MNTLAASIPVARPQAQAAYPDPAVPDAHVSRDTRSPSAVSWSAVFAGATGAAILSMLLMLLGSGLSLSAASPWNAPSVSATTLLFSSIIWLSVTQLLSAGFGGYLAGRLRTKWTGIHSDEMHFRDTAHGFLAWAVATLTIAIILASTVGSIVSGTAKAGATLTGTALAGTAVAATGAGAAAAATNGLPSLSGSGSSSGNSMGYFVDSLFRRPPNPSGSAVGGNNPRNAADMSTGAETAEVTRIFANDIASGALTTDDTQYLGQLVAQRTGLSQPDAETRVADTFNTMQQKIKAAQDAAKQAADTARKTSGFAALWLVVSLLIGAFVASWTATWGGRRRDA